MVHLSYIVLSRLTAFESTAQLKDVLTFLRECGYEGVEFNILNEEGVPVVTFGYLDPIDTARARGLIEKAIVDAVLITGGGR